MDGFSTKIARSHQELRVLVHPSSIDLSHDLTAARTHGIVEALAAAGLKCWVDKAYQGAGCPVRVPSEDAASSGGSGGITARTPRSAASAKVVVVVGDRGGDGDDPFRTEALGFVDGHRPALDAFSVRS